MSRPPRRLIFACLLLGLGARLCAGLPAVFLISCRARCLGDPRHPGQRKPGAVPRYPVEPVSSSSSSLDRRWSAAFAERFITPRLGIINPAEIGPHPPRSILRRWGSPSGDAGGSYGAAIGRGLRVRCCRPGSPAAARRHRLGFYRILWTDWWLVLLGLSFRARHPSSHPRASAGLFDLLGCASPDACTATADYAPTRKAPCRGRTPRDEERRRNHDGLTETGVAGAASLARARRAPRRPGGTSRGVGACRSPSTRFRRNQQTCRSAWRAPRAAAPSSAQRRLADHLHGHSVTGKTRRQRPR